MMMKKKQYNNLYKRAKKIYAQCLNKENISIPHIAGLIDELMIYQIELEIQNEDLIEAQVNLEQSRKKYADLYDLAPLGYFCISKSGLIKEVNAAGCHLLGLNKKSLINRCFLRYIATEFQILFSEYRRILFKDVTTKSFEIKMTRWNQSSFHAGLDCKVIENSSTSHRQLLLFITDISSRKLIEESLHQQRIKMASIDRVRSLSECVYGLSENQNHSITLINNYIYGCIRRLEMGNYKPNELLEILKKTALALQGLEDMIRHKKEITSKSVLHYEYADINSIINQIMLLLAHEIIDFPVTIQYQLTSHAANVKLDRLHIQQIIINLVRNAIEAMRDGNIKEPKLLIETIQKNSAMIEVTIYDNGPGLYSDSISKLFEPHYTTKPYSVGLGLTVSRAVIEKHGGELWARSNPLGGACFSFTLPCLC